jgi:hypothetical protein
VRYCGSDVDPAGACEAEVSMSSKGFEVGKPGAVAGTVEVVA